MPFERTLAIVKPDCLAEGHAGECLSAWETAGTRLVGARVVRLCREVAAAFYAEHKGKSFFEGLLDYMTSGPILALEGENAVAVVRTTNGATDPAEAAEGTLRRRFGSHVSRNAVHASATLADAEREVAFFFPSLACDDTPPEGSR